MVLCGLGGSTVRAAVAGRTWLEGRAGEEAPALIAAGERGMRGRAADGRVRLELRWGPWARRTVGGGAIGVCAKQGCGAEHLPTIGLARLRAGSGVIAVHGHWVAGRWVVMPG